MKRVFNSDREIKALKPDAKRYSAKDASTKGLFLDIKPTGIKTWLYRYTYDGKQNTHTIGQYPDLSLAEARVFRNELANRLAKGESPKTEPSNSPTVYDLGQKFYREQVCAVRKNPMTQLVILENDIYPLIGHKTVETITTEDIRSVIWRKKDQGYAAAANGVKGLLKRMFDYAMTMGLVAFNPVLAIPTKHVHRTVSRQRYLSVEEISIYFAALAKSRIYRARKIGLLLSLLTMLRKSELLKAKWEHVNFDTKEWYIPDPKADSKTGQSRPMVVYMSSQVCELLHELKAIAGDEPYIFVGRKRGTHISHNAFNTAHNTVLALTDLTHFTIHDFRRTASTHLNEKGYNSDAIEKCLNHVTTGVRGIYNKAEYAEERKEMMQDWANFIYKLCY